MALALAALLSACQPKSGPNAVVLKVGSQKGGTKSLMLASHALDGAPYKVEWSEFPSAQTLMEAVAAGAADAGAVGDAPFIFAYAAGSKIRVVAATRTAGGGTGTAVLVRPDSPIHKAADLRGKRIATGRGSIGHYVLLRILEKAGLTPKDVTIVFLGPSDAKAALDSNSVDAWVAWGAFIGVAQLHDHDRVIADGQRVTTGLGFEAGNDAAVAAKHVQFADFLHRLANAQRWELTHKDEYAAVLSKETGLPLDVARFTVAKLRGVPVPIDASIVAEEREVLSHYVKAGVIAKAPNIDNAFDTSFNASVAP